MYNQQLKDDVQDFLSKTGRHWKTLLSKTKFSSKLLKKCPYMPTLASRIINATPKLSDKDFTYTFTTRIYWILHNINDFPLCTCDQKPIKKWNIPGLDKAYKSTCCKECERKSAQHSIVETMKDKYGVENAFQLKTVIDNNISHHDEWIRKCHDTRKKNKTFSTSKSEDTIYSLLINKFGEKNVRRQYQSEEYPFQCDFYIRSIKTYIECNFSWTHGSVFYDPNNSTHIQQLNIWKHKAETSDFYKNAIYTWTVRDVNKHQTVINNKLNMLTFWNVEEAEQWIKTQNNVKMIETPCDFNHKLSIPFNKLKAEQCIAFFKKADCTNRISHIFSHNYLIKYFQQDVFYKNEQQLWLENKDDIRSRLIENRKKYLHKEEDELSSLELLEGFKLSGLYYGYSHFNPLWFKYFLQHYNIQTCYDPCGGWGHRLLGAMNIKQYIYNDLSLGTKTNVDRMIQYLKLTNTTTYNNNARVFIPEEKFEAMFTCPPYFNVEQYECDGFVDRQNFDDFINALFNVFHKKSTCKIFGIIIREDLLDKHQDYVDKILLSNNRSAHLTNSYNKNKEYMYIYRKDNML